VVDYLRQSSLANSSNQTASPVRETRSVCSTHSAVIVAWFQTWILEMLKSTLASDDSLFFVVYFDYSRTGVRCHLNFQENCVVTCVGWLCLHLGLSKVATSTTVLQRNSMASPHAPAMSLVTAFFLIAERSKNLFWVSSHDGLVIWV
jgi:hypothetical protein